MNSRLVTCLVLILTLFGCLLIRDNNAEHQVNLQYVFAVDRSSAASHIAHVSLKVRPFGRFSVSFRFWPVIALDDGLDVLEFRAFDEKERQLETTLSHVEKRKTWTVQARDVQELRIEYDISMNFFRATGATLDHGYAGYLSEDFGVTMASWVFLVPELFFEGVKVEFALPDGWVAVTPWPSQGTAYYVSSTEYFVSSVFAVGKFDQYSRIVAGTNVTIATFSEWPRFVKWSVTEYSFRAYEMLTRIFGTSVQERYLSIYTPRTKDGRSIEWLEWTQAQACAINPQGDAVFEALVGILHRAFHNWNAFPPYGMSRRSNEEQWFSEGVNRYYDDDKIPIQLGVMRQHIALRYRYEDYLRLIVGTKYDVAVAYASQFEWDYYARLAYGKGSLIGFLLDELIRSLTQDNASLDMVLARMYERYGTPRSTRSYLAPANTAKYSNQDILQEVNRLTGRDLHRFFSLHIYGNSQLPFQRIGERDLQVDWPKLSAQLGLNLTPSSPVRPHYTTIGSLRIDGLASDWAGLDPTVSDARGDSKKEDSKTDLRAVYAVATAEYLCVMIQLWDKPDPKNDYIFPVDLDGDGLWDYSFGFNLDRIWMYDLHGVPKGQWPRERVCYPCLPYGIDEVAEIAIPLPLLGNPSSITIWVWVNNGGVTVDETAPGHVSFLSGKQTTARTLQTTTSPAGTAATSVSPSSRGVLGFQVSEFTVFLIIVGLVSMAIIVYRLRMRGR